MIPNNNQEILSMLAEKVVTNGRSQRVVTNQQLVGRLALQRLGSGVSGKLMHGEDVAPKPEDAQPQ